jgi:hypothetical protein
MGSGHLENSFFLSPTPSTKPGQLQGEQWDRLTQEEQDHLMRLLAKLQGRWVEPQPSSIETTAMPVTKKGKS